MNGDLMATASMGVAVALSPEIFLLGMWLASLPERALRKAWLFWAGGTVGLLSLVILGFFISSAAPAGPSWLRFCVRAAFGLAMVACGCYAFFKERKEDATTGSARFANRMTSRVAFGLGFVITGVNIKVIAMATAAGGKIAESSGSGLAHAGEIAVFYAIGALPLIVPALIESVKRGLVAAIMAPCSRIFERYGKWIVAAIAFFIGIKFLIGAFRIMP